MLEIAGGIVIAVLFLAWGLPLIVAAALIAFSGIRILCKFLFELLIGPLATILDFYALPKSDAPNSKELFGPNAPTVAILIFVFTPIVFCIGLASWRPLLAFPIGWALSISAIVFANLHGANLRIWKF